MKEIHKSVEEKEKPWKPVALIWRGALFGAANVIPGVSGGTIAVSTGVYDTLIKSISNIIRYWKILFFFLLGAGLGLLIAAFGLEVLFEKWPGPTLFAFMGFILGGFPSLWKRANLGPRIKAGWVILFLAAFTVIVLMGLFLSPGQQPPVTQWTPRAALWVFLAGGAAAAAMVIPGISGSLLLLLLGMYSTFVSALTHMNLPILLTAALGVGLGILLISRLISVLLKKWHRATYAAILGLVLGSVVVLWPGLPKSWSILFSLSALFAGGIAGFILSD